MREGLSPGWGLLGPTLIVDKGGYGYLGVREGLFPGQWPLGPTLIVDKGFYG